MIKYRLAQIVNPIFKIFGYEFQRMAQFTDDFEIIFHPWQLKQISYE
jgi:hypothetical protein